MFLTHALRAIFRAAVVTGDSLWKFVTLLISGTPPAVTFISDASTNGNVLTLNGDTRPSNFNPYTPGYYSNFFDGTGDAISAPASTTTNFETSNFTIEAWVYLTAGGSFRRIYSLYGSAGATQVFLRIETANTIRFYTIPNVVDYTSTVTLTLNTWNHIAVVRNGSAFTTYLNGVSVASATSSAAMPTTTTLPSFISGLDASSELWLGYISNLRVVKGTAVYTAAFTPPTAPLTAINGTSLLTCQSNRLIDNSLNNFVITKNGDTTVSGFTPFTPTASYNGSAYFDGTGDYLSVPASTAMVLSGDFTIECWVYTSTLSGNQGIIASSAQRFGLIRLTNYFYWLGSTDLSGSSITISANTWYHVAVSRSGTTLRLFVNGVQANSGTYSEASTSNIWYIGSNQSNEQWNGYISDLRVVNGTAVYTAAFTPPTAPLTAVTNTRLLTLQTDQPAANKQFVDNSGNNFPITQAGNATQGTFSPYGANWSNYFDGTGDYLSIPDSTAFTMGSGDFTIECWINLSTLSGSQMVIGTADAPGNQGSMSFVLNVNSGTPRIGVGYGNAVYYATAASTITANTWVHLAGVRNGASVYIYVNGVQSTALNMASLAINDSTQIVAVGRNGNYNGEYVTGYISNVRIVKGTAVYTAAFTPPTAPLTAVSGTSLLTCQSKSFVDNSSNAFAITRNGDVSVQRFSPFSPVIQTPTTYSTYFDGTGDYLTATSSTAFTLGTGDFTIECWFYTAAGTNTAMFQLSNTAGGFNATYVNTIAIGLLSGKINLYGVAGTGITSTGSSYATSTWTHVALVRSSGVTKLYINGVLDTTVGTAGSITDTTSYTMQYIVVGGYYSTSYLWNGYVSNLRVVKGTAVYTAAFTPPTAPLTAITNTSLLTCQSATHIDNSPNAFTLTQNGDAAPRQFNPFGFTNTTTGTAYTPALYGGSAYFDGTGDYLDVVSNAALEPGSGDFTAELWVYPTAYPASGTGAGLLLRNNSGVTYSNFTTNLRSNGQVEAYFSLSNPASVPSIITGGSVPLGAWAHIALVKTGLVAKLFVNGVLVGTATNGSNPPTGLTTGTWLGKADGSLTGYISDARITKGQALYTGGFVPPIAPLQAVKNTVLLLNMDKSGITDSSRCVDLETVGDAKIRYESPYSGSYYSNYFDGSGDYLSIPSSANLAFGTGNFCVELWYYQSTSAVVGLFSNSISSGSGGDTQFEIQLDSSLRPQLVGWASVFLTSSISSTLNIWNHLVVNRSGTTVSIFLNGTRVATAAVSNNFSSTNAFNIGRQASNAGYLTGFVSNLRVTKGSSVYDPTQSTITVPTQPLAVIANTELLTCQSKSFVDNSSNNFTITRSGDVAVKSQNPFQKNTYSSMFFDGTGDYLHIPQNELLNPGTGQFTIEMWLNPTTTVATAGFYAAQSSGSDSRLATQYYNATGLGISRASGWIAYTSTVPATGSWTHIAFTRDSSNAIRIFFNGVAQTLNGGAGTTITDASGFLTTPMRVGEWSGAVFNGYIADLRITKGSARYTANFTPPTAPLPTS